MDSSEFLSLLRTRSSVRAFYPDAPDSATVDAIASTASLAPSAGNREGWDVVVVADEEVRRELADAALGQLHVAEAPIVYVVCANYVRSMSRYGERGILYAVQDATIACTYMMLAAHAHHLGSCWTGAFDEDEVRGILGLPPHIRPIALLPVGTPRVSPEKTDRIGIEEHIHRDAW